MERLNQLLNEKNPKYAPQSHSQRCIDKKNMYAVAVLSSNDFYNSHYCDGKTLTVTRNINEVLFNSEILIAPKTQSSGPSVPTEQWFQTHIKSKNGMVKSGSYLSFGIA